jgi:phosphatidylserine/phosphatidylglycerophosphate/cardiolipin synthase-like enzyme
LKKISTIWVLSAIFILPLFVSPLNAQNKLSSSPSTWSVYFSPNGGCTDAIVRELNNAKSSILMQAYSFTSAPIARALLEAHKKGITIEVNLDKSQLTEKYSSVTFLYNSGIPIRIDSSHAIAHNRIMIIDRETVITGSFNFTKAAEEKNAENLLVIRDRVLAGKYIENWKGHAEHSELYGRKRQVADRMGQAVKKGSLKPFREWAFLSKAELARKAGISAETISRIENGKSCRLEAKLKIILAFGLELSESDKIFGDVI